LDPPSGRRIVVDVLMRRRRQTRGRAEKGAGARHFINRNMTQRLVAPLLDFGGTPSMCVVVSNREKPMDTTASSFTARNNAKRAAEKMIANGGRLRHSAPR
jgi:hypothetical protein